jgi:hypothetical protein
MDLVPQLKGKKMKNEKGGKKMKKSRKTKLFTFIVLFFMTISNLTGICFAFKNSPHKSKNPNDINDYSFDEKNSDYGTHDWIADAALRFLYEKNHSKWNWLLHDKYDTAPDITLRRNPEYKDFNGRHNIIRSYLYFLLGTHWPDHDHPPTLYFREEGEWICNGRYNLGSWIGETHYHTYYYDVIMSNKSQDNYKFIPKGIKTNGKNRAYQKAPEYAIQFGDLAYRCLSHQEKNLNGKWESWAKVETAAFFLGCMTHYITDVAAIPHILKANDMDPLGNQKINYWAGKKFHEWYESNIDYFTYWGSSRNSLLGAGPNDDFFVIDLTKIGQNIASISPIDPDLAAVELSKTVIMESFGEVGGGNLPKNLYINNDHRRLMYDTWIDWEFDQRNSNREIIPNGLKYKEYFDKVEKLLIYAIFYTARAMLWVMNKVIKKTNMNTDKWAEIPFYKRKLAQPIEVPVKGEIVNKGRREEYKKRGSTEDFANLAIMAPIFGLVIIPHIINISEKIAAS